MASVVSGSRARRRGLLKSIWYGVWGEPDEGKRELKQAMSHGAAVLALARAWAIPLMVFFSIGALVTLGGVPLEHNLALIEAGQPPDWVELGGLVVTVMFVIGMDLAMITASIFLNDARARGAQFGEVWKLWALMLSVGALEAATFIKMVANYEHPTSAYDWGLLIARGVLAPIIAVFLSLATERAVSRDDVVRLLQVRSGEGLLTWLEQTLAIMRDKGVEAMDASHLFGFFALVNGATQEQLDWDKRVMAVMEQMAPASVHAAAQREVEEARRVALEAEARVAKAVEASGQRVGDALLGLMTTGHLPEWLVEQRPDLAGVSLETLTGSSATRQRGPRRVATLTTRADRIRAWLNEVDIEEARRPAEARRGIFLSTGAVATLLREPLGADELRRLMNDAGSGMKSGTALVAPVERVVAELRRRSLMNDVAGAAWTRLVGDTSASEGEEEGAA